MGFGHGHLELLGYLVVYLKVKIRRTIPQSRRSCTSPSFPLRTITYFNSCFRHLAYHRNHSRYYTISSPFDSSIKGNMPNPYSSIRNWLGVVEVRRADKRGGRWSGSLLRSYQRHSGGYWRSMESTSPAGEKEPRMGTWKSTHQRLPPKTYKQPQHQSSRSLHSHSNPPKNHQPQPPNQQPRFNQGWYHLQTRHSPAHPDSHPPQIIKSIHLRSPESYQAHHLHYPCLVEQMLSEALVHPV